MVTSIIRLIVLIPSLTNTDQTWVIGEGSLWIIVEANLYVFSKCGSYVRHILTLYTNVKIHHMLLLTHPTPLLQARSSTFHRRK
jgi:hypothetical protein